MAEMMTILLVAIFFGLGAVVGSYLVATIWRLRAADLAARTRLIKAEQVEFDCLVTQSGLSEVTTKKDYSRCLSCQQRLAWTDLIPIWSWLRGRGKCRYCRAPIGWLEFLTELAMGVLYAMTFWLLRNETWYMIGLWLMLLSVLALLFIYDLKWKLLPSAVLYLGVGLSVVFAIVQILTVALPSGLGWAEIITNYLMAWVCLGGIYLLLTIISRGAWVGDGDWLIGTIVALVLADPRLSFMSLFVANLLGCVAVVVMILKHGKLQANQKTIPLGPLLILSLLLVLWIKDLALEFFVF